jgi:hypothetical protein
VKKIVGIMGPGEQATDVDTRNAYEIGKHCASKGYVVLTGGVNLGVMNAGLMGAREMGGLTIGLLPDRDRVNASQFVDVAICTGMGAGRNYINALSSDVLVACGLGAGTASEICLSIRAGKKVVLVGLDERDVEFFVRMAATQVFEAKDAKDACEMIDKLKL